MTPLNVEVAVEVAVKNGASKLPVERMVAAAVWEGPSMVELAMELVRWEPKAEERQAEAELPRPKAEEEVAEAVLLAPTAEE